MLTGVIFNAFETRIYDRHAKNFIEAYRAADIELEIYDCAVMIFVEHNAVAKPAKRYRA